MCSRGVLRVWTSCTVCERQVRSGQRLLGVSAVSCRSVLFVCTRVLCVFVCSSARLWVAVDPTGFACPAGTGYLNASHRCTSPQSYCPLQSAARIPTPAGFYGVKTSQDGLYFNITECEPGRYCDGGVAYACPSGRYGMTAGLLTSNCSGPCAQGYYCDASSVSPTQAQCSTGAQRYCPEVRLSCKCDERVRLECR